VFFDNDSMGFTKNGKIRVSELDTIPSTVIFETNYKQETLIFSYKFPEDYLEWREIPFEITQEELDQHILERTLQKEDRFSNISELHWGHIPLTYKFESECIERLSNLMRGALGNITYETNSIVTFKEVFENPDISIYCKEGQYLGEQYAFGDSIHNLNKYNSNLIINGEINIYGQGITCPTGYPALEVHEILHLFGFGHTQNIQSIMYPSAFLSRYCTTTKINDEYTSCLKYIYSNGKEGECNIKNSVYEGPLDFVCEEGWYEVEGSEFCCPEPDMVIIDDYCYES